MVSFSIVIVTEGENNNLIKLLESLKEFRDRGGEVCLLNSNSSISTDIIATKWGCRVDPLYKSKKPIDTRIGKNNYIDTNLLNSTYTDFSDLKNHAVKPTSNNKVLVINWNSFFVNLNIDEVEKYLNEGYEILKIKTDNNESNEFYPVIYYKTKCNWSNIIFGVLKSERILKKTVLPPNVIKIDNDKDIMFKHDDFLTELVAECFNNPANDKASKFFAIQLMHRGLFDAAVNELNRHLSICDSKMERAESLSLIGDCYIRHHNEKEIIEHYNRSYLECPEYDLSLYKIGKYFFIMGKCKEAILYLEGYVNSEKRTDDSYNLLSRAYENQGNLEKGKYYFNKAIEIDPYNVTYLSRANKFYEYIGNNIIGKMSFNETQYLYNLSKKFKSVLEINYENSRSTHAILRGCKGKITVVTQKTISPNFQLNIEKYDNAEVLQMTSEEAREKLKGQTFEMVFINGETSVDNIKRDISVWEKQTTKLICGNIYKENKVAIDSTTEIGGVEENIWYRNLNTFQKGTYYLSKEPYAPISISKKKMAICLSGYLRTFKECYPSILENVIQDYDCDIFIHTYDKIGNSSGWRSPVDLSENLYIDFLETIPNIKTIITEKWHDIKFKFEKFRKLQPLVTNIDVLATIAYKIYKANELKKEYERKNNFIYDIVVRMRGDQIFEKKIDYDFPMDKILLNAYPWGDEEYVSHFQCLNPDGTIDDKHEKECLNDRFAVGTSENIDYLANLYLHFEEYIQEGMCVTTENVLYRYLKNKPIELEKRNLNFYVNHKPPRLIRPS